jgi:hypothetical protein
MTVRNLLSILPKRRYMWPTSPVLVDISTCTDYSNDRDAIEEKKIARPDSWRYHIHHKNESERIRAAPSVLGVLFCQLDVSLQLQTREFRAAIAQPATGVNEGTLH